MTRRLALASLLAASLAHRLEGQESVRVVGRVRDAGGTPVVGASVSVTRTLWQASAGLDGIFVMRLPAGRWELTVRRLGFMPVRLDVEVSRAKLGDTLDVRLAESPSQLNGITVIGDRSPPLAATVPAASVRHVPPVGEPDIFRLLPMLPGVSQPNDLIGRLHLAGGASDEHGITLDGHPLQAPLHVLSVIGAFDVASLERVDVLRQHLPASRDGHLSGAIDLVPRQPSGQAFHEADVSILSASLTMDRSSAARGLDALASGRITYMDRVLGSYARSTGASDDLTLPSFADGLVRVSRDFGGRWSSELLGYGTLDSWGATKGPQVIPPRWGEGMLGAKIAYRASPWVVSLRASVDRAMVRFQQPNDSLIGTSVVPTLDFIDLHQYWTSAAIQIERVSRHWSGSTGLTIDARNNRHHWAGSQVHDWFSAALPTQYDSRSSQSVAGAFADGSFLSGARWNGTLGAHLSNVDGASFLAPRALVGARLGSDWRVDVAAERRHQFDAIANEPIEGSITQPTFLLHTPRVADLVTMSTSWHPTSASAWRGEAAVFARRDRDRTLLEPASSADSFPVFRRVPGRVLGASATFGYAAGNGIAFQGSYTFERVRETVDGDERPSQWDVPHNVAAFVDVPLGSHWGVSSAVQWHSGVPVTPVIARIFTPIAAGVYVPRYLWGDINSERLPMYTRIDLGVRHTWVGWGADWALSVQALNVLARTNVLDRNWTTYFACTSGIFRSMRDCSARASTRSGLPILPSIGVQVRW